MPVCAEWLQKLADTCSAYSGYKGRGRSGGGRFGGGDARQVRFLFGG